MVKVSDNSTMNEQKYQIYQLVDCGIDPSTGAIALHHWAAQDNLENIKQVFNALGMSALLITDYAGNSLLHYAVANSSVRVANFLVQLFKNNHFFNTDKLTPGHIAAQNGNVEMLEILSQAEFILTDKTDLNWTPLHYAIYNGQIQAVEYLLSYNSVNEIIYGAESPTAFLHHRCLRFVSPLDLAKITDHPDIAALLEKNHALPSIHASVIFKNLQAITYHALSPFSTIKDNLDAPGGVRKISALQIAARLGLPDVSHFLLESHCSASMADVNGFTPLKMAVVSGNIDTVKMILEYTMTDKISDAAFLAMDISSDAITSEICNSRMLPDSIDPNGDNLVIRLLKRKKPSIAIRLVRTRTLPLTTVDSRGASALHYAAATAPELVSVLIEGGCDPNLPDMHNMTPLYYAVIGGLEKSINLLSGTDVDYLCDNGLSPYSAAIAFRIKNDLSPTNETLQRKYSVNISQLTDTTVFQDIAVQNMMVPSIEPDTMEEVQCATAQIYGANALKALKSATAQSYISAFGDELKGGTLLHLAVIFGSDNVIPGILAECNKREIPILDVPDEEGRTPLHVAARLNEIRMVELFMQNNANIAAKDNNGNTIFHFIICDNFNDIISKGNINLTASSIFDLNNLGENAFHLICQIGAHHLLKTYYSIVEPDNSLLEQPDKNGLTPLDHALRCQNNENRAKVFDFLHSHDIDNRLVTAARKGDLQMVKTLVEQGYPINSCIKGEITALHIAAGQGYLDIVNYLLAHGADPQRANSNHYYPIHEAAIGGHFDIVLTLLKGQFKMAPIAPSEQPCMVAKDAKCRDVLFHFWKRQVMILRLYFLARDRMESMKILENVIQPISESIPGTNFPELATQLCHALNAVFIGLLERTSKGYNPYDFSQSVHHLLGLLYMIDKKLVNDYAIEVSQLVLMFQVGQQLAGYTDIQLIFMSLFPLQAIANITGILDTLSEHIIPEIDDIGAFQNVLNHMKELEQFASITFTSIKHVFSSRFEVLKKKRNLGNIMLIVNCKIKDIFNKHQQIFDSQVFKALHDFLGSSFSYPRWIPFTANQSVRCFLSMDSLIIASEDNTQFLDIPLIFIHHKQMKNESNFGGSAISQFFTPFGQFKLVLNANQFAPVFNNLLITRLDEIREISAGESLYQTTKNKLFRCLVLYYAQGRSVQMRLMTVRAGREQECYDICHQYISETLSQPPQMFVVKALELIPDEGIILC